MSLPLAVSRTIRSTKPVWHLVDAKGQVTGRLATQLSYILRGKVTALARLCVNAEMCRCSLCPWDGQLGRRDSGATATLEAAADALLLPTQHAHAHLHSRPPSPHHGSTSRRT